MRTDSVNTGSSSVAITSVSPRAGSVTAMMTAGTTPRSFLLSAVELQPHVYMGNTRDFEM